MLIKIERMLFNSYPYILLFLPITIIIYFVLNKKKLIIPAKIWLVLMSFLFYSRWNQHFTIILLASILFNFAVASWLNLSILKPDLQRKIILTFGLVTNVLVLGYFKYFNFFMNNIDKSFPHDWLVFGLFIPLGLSFYTFVQITYLVDSYRNETKKYNFLDYSLFISFFPHLIAGPIVHHSEIIPQFQQIKTKVFQYKNVILGLALFAIGLVKKVILANAFSQYALMGYTHSGHLSMIESWVLSLSYTFQIYFDFSAYTDMALGSAKMFNIDFPINFNSPYKSASVREFWRRWHITLSRFLRNYIYIPLGGNRRGEIRKYINLLITFFIAGLWHGASWMFVLWGMMHGVALCINHFWEKLSIRFSKIFNIFITFMFVNISWVVFRSKDLKQAGQVFKSMFNFADIQLPQINHLNVSFGTHGYENLFFFLPLALILVFACKNSQELVNLIRINSKKKALIYSIVLSMIFLICLFKIIYIKPQEFIYFNF